MTVGSSFMSEHVPDARILTKLLTNAGLPYSFSEKTTGFYVLEGTRSTWIDWVRGESPLATPLSSIPEIVVKIEKALTPHGYKVKRHESAIEVTQ